jgi:lambda repressor-like predicted transcriptional regulator
MRNMKQIKDMVLAIEAELKGKGIPVCNLTTEAGIAPSTWTRWKAGSNSPYMETWAEVIEAKARLIKKGKK